MVLRKTRRLQRRIVVVAVVMDMAVNVAKAVAAGFKLCWLSKR